MASETFIESILNPKVSADSKGICKANAAALQQTIDLLQDTIAVADEMSNAVRSIAKTNTAIDRLYLLQLAMCTANMKKKLNKMQSSLREGVPMTDITEIKVQFCEPETSSARLFRPLRSCISKCEADAAAACDKFTSDVAAVLAGNKERLATASAASAAATQLPPPTNTPENEEDLYA
jgi:hypothetical protein